MNHRGAIALAALFLAGCSASEPTSLQGYIEGTYVYVSPQQGGRIVERPAGAGTSVKQGEVLVRLDDANEVQALAGAQARLAQAQAQLENLQSGKRPEELAVLVAQLDSARSSFTSANDDYTRKLALRERGVVAQAVVDTAKATRDTAQAQVDAAQRQLDVARLPARDEEIAAAERNVAAEEASVEQAKIALAWRTVLSPADGDIEETFFEPGELVAANQPVVSILPAANRKIRFFVPEPLLASIHLRSKIGVSCDGCPQGLTGEVTFVATASEFTPPVLYSRGNREKLVYRVEAKPMGNAAALNIGQPVDVSLTPGT